MATTYVVVRVLAFGGDASRFVVAGDAFTAPEQARVTVLHGSTGYDGQFYYRLAADPFSDRERVLGVAFPTPGYFRQRIGYPLMVHVVAAGTPATVVAALIAVNVAAFGAIAALGARLARQLGRTPWAGLAFAAWPGFWITLGRDLTELTAMTFVLAAVLTLERDRWAVATIALVAAVLTRETTVLVAVAVVVEAVRRRSATWMVAGAAPALTFALVQVALFTRWHTWPVREGDSGWTGHIPMSGLARALQHVVGDGADAALPLLLIAGVVVAAAWAVGSVRRSVAPPYVCTAFLGYVLLAVALPTLIWRYDTNFLRATTEAYCLGLLVVLGDRQRQFDSPAIALGTLSLGTAAIHVTVP
jgi:hypothetical protein